MALYASRLVETEGTDIPRACGERFGLIHLDHNRGAEDDAVTALTVQDDALDASPYIPKPKFPCRIVDILALSPSKPHVIAAPYVRQYVPM